MKLPIGCLALVVATLSSIALTGCTMNSNPAGPATIALGTIQGRAMGGQQPISGMNLYVYAASTSGYGAASTNLINGGGSGSVFTTDINGNFNITGTYTCTAGQQVYLYGTGGNSGSGTNAAISEMAVLGACGSFGASTFVVMSEVTTVAAAYSLSGFAVDSTHIADDETVTGNTTAAIAKVGMANAFSNAANLVSLNSGMALSTTGNSSASGQTASIIVPQATINTLGNILASCVNSSGAASSSCTTLFQFATSNGCPTGTTGSTCTAGTSPTETATAAINIAHYPANITANNGTVPASGGGTMTANTITNLYALASATAPFAPALTAQPSDFTLSILFPQGGTGTVGLVIDGLGQAYGIFGGGSIMYRITPAGVETAITTVSTPRRLAIDASNNVWVPSDVGTGGGIIQEYTPTSTTATPYTAVDNTGATVVSILSVTFDPNGYLWALSGGTALKATLLNVSTNPATNVTNVTVPAGPAGFAESPLGMLGVTTGTTTAASTLSLYAAGIPAVGSAPTTVVTATGGLNVPGLVIADASGDFWVSNNPTATKTVNATVSEFSPAGTALSGTSGYTFIPPPSTVTYGLISAEFDGVGNYFTGGNSVASGTTTPLVPTIIELNSSGVQIAAFSPSSANNQYFAVDPSGNLWFGGNKTIGEMIGAAAPKVTPVVVANFPGLLAGVTGVNPTTYPNKVATRP